MVSSSRSLGERSHADLTPQQYAALGFPGADDLANMFQFKREFEHDYRAARPISCSRELHPRIQTFAQWLARNKARIPVQPRSMEAA
jgi:hypothetical protein